MQVECSNWNIKPSVKKKISVLHRRCEQFKVVFPCVVTFPEQTRKSEQLLTSTFYTKQEDKVVKHNCGDGLKCDI